MSERVRIDVDDAELDEVLARMDAALRMKQTLVSGVGLSKPTLPTKVKADVDQILLDAGGLDAILLDIDLAKKGLDDIKDDPNLNKLPSINRNLRIVLGQVPGMRAAMALYFRLTNLMAGFEAGGPMLYLSLIANTILLIRILETSQEKVEARLQALERERDVRAITLEEAIRGYGALPERYRSTIPP